ncbi:hypothetical protein VTK56DRAFT_4249 [Thermocarpiscus australiensis]
MDGLVRSMDVRRRRMCDLAGYPRPFAMGSFFFFFTCLLSRSGRDAGGSGFFSLSWRLVLEKWSLGFFSYFLLFFLNLVPFFVIAAVVAVVVVVSVPPGSHFPASVRSNTMVSNRRGPATRLCVCCTVSRSTLLAYRSYFWLAAWTVTATRPGEHDFLLNFLPACVLLPHLLRLGPREMVGVDYPARSATLRLTVSRVCGVYI